jgi:hypothetical protein
MDNKDQLRLPGDMLWEYKYHVEHDKLVKTIDALKTAQMQAITLKAQLNEAQRQIDMYKKSEERRQVSDMQKEASDGLEDVKKRMADFAGVDGPDKVQLDDWTGLLYTFDDDGDRRPLTVQKPKAKRSSRRRSTGTKK